MATQNPLVRDSSTGRFIAIVDDIVLLMAHQEPDFNRNRGKAIKRVRARMIMDLKNDKLPIRDEVDFRPVPGANASGFTISFNEKGIPFVDPCKTMGLRAEAMLPGKDGNLVETSVRPAFVCDGLSGFIPYVQRIKAKDAQGEPGTDGYKPAVHTWTSTGKMPCIFFQPPIKKGKKAPPPVAVPLGLARPFLLDAWKTLVEHPDRQHATRKLFVIEPIANNLRGNKRHLVFTPRGNPYTPVWYNKSADKLRDALKRKLNGEANVVIPSPDGQVLTHLFGKVVTPITHKTETPVEYDLPGGKTGCVPCVFRIQEQSGVVKAIYKGEKRHMGNLVAQDLSLDDLEFNALTALGLTMETAMTGRALRKLKNKLLRGPQDQTNPLYMQAVESSGLEPGHHKAQASGPMRFIADSAVEQVETQLNEEINLIAGKLIMPGHRDKPELVTLLGELDGTKLREAAFQREGACILATWVAKTQNWDEFSWGSELHRRVRYKVLMSLAKAADLKMAPKPKPKPAPEPTNGSGSADQGSEGGSNTPKDGGNQKAASDSEAPAEETPRERKNRLARERRAKAKAKKLAEESA